MFASCHKRLLTTQYLSYYKIWHLEVLTSLSPSSLPRLLAWRRPLSSWVARLARFRRSRRRGLLLLAGSGCSGCSGSECTSAVEQWYVCRLLAVPGEVILVRRLSNISFLFKSALQLHSANRRISLIKTSRIRPLIIFI